MADKNYIKGIQIKEGKFDLRIGLNLKTFFEDLSKIQNDKGYANVLIVKKKEPGKYGETHYCVENQWKPENQSVGKTEQTAYKSNQEVEEDTSQDLPF